MMWVSDDSAKYRAGVGAYSGWTATITDHSYSERPISDRLMAGDRIGTLA
jgi:hypothetical protein